MNYDAFIAKWNGKQVTRFGADMKIMTIISKTHGTAEVILDENDYAKATALGGTWYLASKRGKLYAQKHIDGNVKELHRWLMGEPKGMYVDHINRDTLDNRRVNLRICSNAYNLRNGRIRPQNTSGVPGVRFDKERAKWVAEIMVNYKKVFLGRFVKFEDAVKARLEANERYWTT